MTVRHYACLNFVLTLHFSTSRVVLHSLTQYINGIYTNCLFLCASKPVIRSYTFFPAVVCDTVPSVAKVYFEVEAPNVTFGTHVTFTCSRGYWFGRGVFYHTVTCSADGQWLPELPECKGNVVI